MKAPPLISYKYRSGAAALRCLSDGGAYFASPRELNDSLEAKFDFAGTTQFIDTVANALNELAHVRGHPSGYSFDRTAFGEFELANTTENERFHDASQKIGIFSTASRPDNQPMWAYYCDNSHGVCLELEWSTEVCEKYQLWPTTVSYTRQSRVHNRADDLRKALLEVGYQDPSWTIAQLQEFSLTESFRRRCGIQSMARAVSTKHSDWQHEAELRLIAPRADSLAIMSDILKRVYFVRTDFPEWGPIMTLLHRLYPKVELASLSFEHKEPFVTIQHLETKLVPI